MSYISEQLNLMGLFHDGEFMFASNRLQRVSGGEIRVWDVHLWEAK